MLCSTDLIKLASCFILSYSTSSGLCLKDKVGSPVGHSLALQILWHKGNNVEMSAALQVRYLVSRLTKQKLNRGTHPQKSHLALPQDISTILFRKDQQIKLFLQTKQTKRIKVKIIYRLVSAFLKISIHIP